MTLNNLLVFLALTGIYEPSAVQQLPDGRFLVVEDEKKHPLSLFTLNADGNVRSTPLSSGLFQGDDEFWKLDDLEGLAIDRAGYLYALTSHSRDGDGDEKKSRASWCASASTASAWWTPPWSKGSSPRWRRRIPSWRMPQRFAT